MVEGNEITARVDARPPEDVSNPLEGERPREPQPRDWRWQPDCWDTQMRSGEHYRKRWEYVRQNPVRAGLAPTPDVWPWQGVISVLNW